MTDRGPLSADGSPACPFVAFEDDRDERADRPDHRHRCFAEAEPAPRALAHQEAYCLSSAFPVCPTFQEWARREAAHANADQSSSEPEADDAGVPAMAAAAVVAGAADGQADEVEPDIDDLWSRPPDEPPVEERPHRNPPRDWAAPPPWAATTAAGAAAAASRGEPPNDGPSRPASSAPKEGQGLAGSAADRLAQGKDVPSEWRRPPSERPSVSDTPSAPADPELAGLVGGSGAARSQPPDAVVPPTRPPANRPTVSSTRDRSREREREREKERATADAAGQNDGPSWERRRRFEAYPTIRTRTGLPSIPTAAILFGGVALAAVALFFLPALLGIGGGDNPANSPTPSTVASTAPPSPTPVPEPTPQVYTIKAGDTLSKIARKYGVSLDALLAANKDTISNPNRIRVGDQIIIPLPETDQVPAEPSAEPAAS